LVVEASWRNRIASGARNASVDDVLLPLAAPPRRLPGVVTGPSRVASRADQQLAGRLARRDPAALAELHAAYGRTVLGFLMRALGDRASAEDVFQQVFLEAWERGSAYDPARAAPLTWLMSIARSRAIDQLRRRVPEPRDPASALALLEGDEDPAAALDAQLEQWRFAHLLGLLPAEEADVLRRRFYAGLSQREIAAATGIPLGTVKMRMVQALGRLRELIETQEREA
jgi:RNA polymerase sigma-70 factor (ECF subfamily)